MTRSARFTLWAVVMILLAAAATEAAQVEGVAFEPTVQVGGQTLALNGAGVRTRLMFKVYVAGLYVPQKSTSASTLLAQKGPRRVAITLLRDVDADTFWGALNEGLRNNHTEQQRAALKTQIDALGAIFKALGEVKKGAVIHLDYAAEGARVTVNDTPRGNPIAGEDFYTALLRVWLGDKPADSSLKKAMLGG